MGETAVKKNKKLLPNGKKDRHRNRVPQAEGAGAAEGGPAAHQKNASTAASSHSQQVPNQARPKDEGRPQKRSRVEGEGQSTAPSSPPPPPYTSSFPRNSVAATGTPRKPAFGGNSAYADKKEKGPPPSFGKSDIATPARSAPASEPDAGASADRPSSSALSKMADRVQAVALNKEIAFQANRKDLASATAAYNKAVSNGWANSHTYAAMLNAHVRCGDIDGAETVFQSLRSHPRLRMDVISCTTMMKGYCATGRMDKCVALLRDMQAHKPAIQPNIRTINTILRGCLSNGLVRECDRTFNMIKRDFNLQPDASSWEYEALMLCEGLQFDKVYPMIGRLKSESILPSSSMMTIYTAVAKALAVVQDWSNCRKYIGAAREAIQADADSAHQSSGRADDPLIDVSDSEDEEEERPRGKKAKSHFEDGMEPEASRSSIKTSKQAVSGGKRAWREVDAARDQSLEIYQQHKRSELLHDLGLLETYMNEQLKQKPSAGSGSELPMLHFFEKTISFTNDSGSAKPPLLKNIIEKLGLDYYLQKKLNEPASSSQIVRELVPPVVDEPTKTSAKKGKPEKSGSSIPASSSVKIDPILAQVQDRLQNIFDGDVINFSRIFDVETSRSLPLKLEICSGAGEWVAQQALADSGKANWAAMEIKHDRVYQTFLRMAFQNVQNLCSIHGDATAILPKHFAPGSVHSVYVNHPEPPVQFGGWGSKNESGADGSNDQEDANNGNANKKSAGDWSQGKHLLSLEFFAQLERILAPGGTITVVTDNLWYGKMLLRSVASAPHPRLLSPVDVETNPLNQSSSGGSSALSVHDEISGYKLYRGRPGPQVGHVAAEASSYFDR